jgi:DNA primase
VAGRIREEDIAEVREKTRIDDVVSSYVTLRNAGGGSMKGLCPFHDEKSPSFHVTPARSFYHCFGCGEGGDVYTFLMKVDGLSFTDAVERLAERCGVQLRYEDGPGPVRSNNGPNRGRLIDAHNKAQEFYADRLTSADALVARQFLDQRGFDRESAATFGVGFAPRDGEALLSFLRQQGFKDDELVMAGLAGSSGRGPYDRFRGRLLWPIRDASSDVIGFGARRIFDDDRIDAKYLNTSETPIYKKSQVLYGIDLARREMARSSQAVVVEGYTDVMACHLSGIPNAVATCGTSFGDEHARVLRRFLHDHEEFRGEVIFTFDGDAAGQKAALRAFGGDQNFVSQTYVAVEPNGMDPCDLRLSHGPQAVRELVARRVPLYRFVLSNAISKYDLDRADGRIDAVRESAKLVASIRDQSKVTAFAQEISRMVGADIDTNQVLAEVRRAARRSPRDQVSVAAPVQAGRPEVPDLREPRFEVERNLLKLAIQYPASLADLASGIHANDFIHPTYRGVWEVLAASGGPAAGASEPGWSAGLRDRVDDPAVISAISELGVERIRTSREVTTGYGALHVYKLQELTAMRRIAAVKSKLQRTNPIDEAVEYNKMFGELTVLEGHRRGLRDQLVALQ